MEIKVDPLRMITLSEAAARLGYGVPNVRRLIRKGLLRAPRVLPGGRMQAWPSDEFEEMLRECREVDVDPKARA